MLSWRDTGIRKTGAEAMTPNPKVEVKSFIVLKKNHLGQ
jgi:hypothetical protein